MRMILTKLSIPELLEVYKRYAAQLEQVIILGMKDPSFHLKALEEVFDRICYEVLGERPRPQIPKEISEEY